MATPMTLREEKFAALMARYSHSCRVYKLPAPGLVELIEQGKADSPEAEQLLRELFTQCPEPLNAVVLGCTHYPFAAPMLQKILGEKTELLDGGPGVARQTRRRLEAAGLLREGEGQLLIENSMPGNDMIDLWEKYNTHPFVQGLADGTLPKEKFKFFMIQDHLYLMQYAKVFAMGVLKSQREEDMRLFARATEEYILNQLGHSFKSLEFYKSVLR
jgi:hypothetical protein